MWYKTGLLLCVVIVSVGTSSAFFVNANTDRETDLAAQKKAVDIEMSFMPIPDWPRVFLPARDKGDTSDQAFKQYGMQIAQWLMEQDGDENIEKRVVPISIDLVSIGDFRSSSASKPISSAMVNLGFESAEMTLSHIRLRSSQTTEMHITGLLRIMRDDESPETEAIVFARRHFRYVDGEWVKISSSIEKSLIK